MPGPIDVSVEVAFTSGYTTPAASRSWTDVSAYVEADESLDISYGRGDGFSQVEPGRCAVTLDNRDGRFTPGLTTGAYAPNVKLGRPLRIRARYPADQAGNLLAAEQSTIEPAGSATSWTNAPGLFGASQSVARSTVRAWQGTASLLVTWNTASAGATAAGTAVSGLVIGKTYTLSGYVWVPAGNPAVRLAFDLYSGGSSAQSTTTGAWERLSVTWTATVSSLWLVVVNHAASTAGQTVYVDGLMIDDASTLRTFTTTAPPYFDRFTGHVTDWGGSFPGAVPESAQVRVTATSRTARLARGAELRSVIEEEFLLDGPEFYYPLSEAEGASGAGNIAKVVQPGLTVTQRGTGGTLAFGTATGPGTDDLTAPTFTRASSNNGKYLSGTLTTGTYTLFDEQFVMECFFSTSTAATAMTLVEVGQAGGGRLTMYITSAGKLAARLYMPDRDVTSATATGTTTVTDGSTRHARVELTKDGTGTVAIKVYVDDTLEATASGFSVGDYSGVLLLPNYEKVAVGGGFAANSGSYPGDLFTGVIAHVAAWGSFLTLGTSRFADHYAAGITGFSGEASDVRIDRYAKYAGIPTAEVSTDAGVETSIAHIDTTGQSPLDLMQRVAGTERGLLYDDRSGVLRFQARSARYNPATALTLDFALQEVEADLQPVLDDSQLRNDVTGSRVGGPSFRVVDAESVAEFGTYRDDVELVTTSDASVESAVYSAVSRYASPMWRLPSLSVDVVNTATAKLAALLGLDLSSVVALANAPDQLATTDPLVFVEGYSESITGTSWLITINSELTSGRTVWILGDPVYSVLGKTTILA